MKTTISLLTVTLFANLLIAQTTTIPDINFEKALLARGYDTGTPNGSVPTTNIDTVTVLDVYNESISSLKGLEDFTALVELDCGDNQLTGLDISKNTSLKVLDCSVNNLTSLDLTKNIALTWLICYENQLTSVDVTKNIALTWLECSANQISNIDLTKNLALTDLECSYNSISSIDVTKNVALSLLECTENKLTSLDVTKNIALTGLVCSENLISNIDVTKNIAIIYLVCNRNQLTSLDLAANTSLVELNCNNSKLSNLDVSKNSSLTHLFITSNQLTSLNLKNGNNNKMMYLNTKGNPNLKCIEVDDIAYATSNWTDIDAGVRFSTNCIGAGNTGPTVIKGNDTSQRFIVYPNPTKGPVYIELGDTKTALSTTVRNARGQIILTQHFENTDNISLDIDAPIGIYFLTLETELGESKTIKVIKE